LIFRRIMPNTTNFGFKKFPPGAITDDGSQFSSKDRDLIDALLFTLFNHDHRGSDEVSSLQGPASLVFPDLTLGTSGTLPGGRTFYYKFSYVDADGNETQASTTGPVSTPSPLTPPPIPSAVVATTGGTLIPGTYRYALSYYQGTSAQTPAPNILTVVVPTGTNTNTITLTFGTPPDEATGWKIYRRAPDETDYWLLATVLATETNYLDDGTASPDCTKRRPTVNTTNSSNSVTVAIPASELPLDTRVLSWRIYRTEASITFPANSLVATVSDTVTEGGSVLVTTYTDVGAVLGPGIPLQQTAIPPTVPQIDASTAFAEGGSRLPSALAPLAVSQHYTYLPGTLAVQDYNQFSPQYDMLLTKLEAFFLLAPTGVDGSNFVTIRVSDDDIADEVQQVWVDTQPRNEVQQVVKSAAANTWTLTFDGETTATIPAAPTVTEIKDALEALTNITEVFVNLTGTRTWSVEFSDPGGQNVPEMTGTVDISGTITVTTLIEGSDGGDFTLSDGVDETNAIMFDDTGATLATRLETDITSIVDVTVTGTGTEIDPWVITWVDPGGTVVPILQMNDAGLIGTGSVERLVRGHGPTIVDLDVQTTVQYHSWEAPLLLEDSQEAEDAPAVSTGVDVSDAQASNGDATELTGTDTVNWPVGVLDTGVYTALFYVAPTDADAVLLSVIDANGPTVLASMTVAQSRPSYTPAFELEFEADGVADIEFEVELVTGTTVRVDKFEWQLILPTLHAGAVCTVEVLVTGSPTTNGDDVQFSIWH
jgi:hypothetical protein